MNETEPKSTSHPRTGAATAGKMRAGENRKAAALTSRGWLCIAPEDAARVRALLETSNPR